MTTTAPTIVRAARVALAACALAVPPAQAPAQPHAYHEVQARRTADAPWVTYRARTVDLLPGYRPVERPRLSRFGGSLARRYRATGFFRTERVGDRWWLIDPEGHPFVHVAVVALSPGGSPGTQAALGARWGTEADWMRDATAMLRAHGFNGSGYWSADHLIRRSPGPLVYTAGFNPMSALNAVRRREAGGRYRNAGWQGYENDLIYVWDPRFEQFADSLARRLAEYEDDPYLLGYFSDNELPFKNDALDRHLKFLPPADPGHAAARAWLARRKRKAAVSLADVTDADRQAFLGFYSDRYYSVVSRAIRRYDPRHLYLGGRFNQETEELRSPAVFGAAGRYADVISVNIYRVWEPGQDRLASWARWSGRPILVTEWYTKGDDARMANTTGAGWIVPTQRDRGRFYQNFALELLRSKQVVGWHWFKYQDNDPADPGADWSNRDSNKGVVDARFVPYTPLLEEMRALNTQVYDLIAYFDRGAGR